MTAKSTSLPLPPAKLTVITTGAVAAWQGNTSQQHGPFTTTASSYNMYIQRRRTGAHRAARGVRYCGRPEETDYYYTRAAIGATRLCFSRLCPRNEDNRSPSTVVIFPLLLLLLRLYTYMDE